MPQKIIPKLLVLSAIIFLALSINLVFASAPSPSAAIMAAPAFFRALTGFQVAQPFTSSVSSTTSNSVTITWTQPTLAFDFYRLNQRPCGKTWQWVADVFSYNPEFQSRTHTFTNLVTSTCYEFRVIAMKGTSGSYSVAQFTTPEYVSATPGVTPTPIKAAENKPPTASFTASPETGTAPLTVNFDASASSDPEKGTLTYSWDFGDKTTTGTGVKVSHTYTSAGTYTATLTVTDNQKATNSATEKITISAGAVEPSKPSKPSGITLSIKEITANSVFIEWTKYESTELENYLIQIKKSAEKSFVDQVTVTKEKTSAVVSPLEPSTQYDIKVLATDKNGKQLAVSNIESAKTSSESVTSFVLRAGTPSKTKVSLSWNKYADPSLTYYIIQIKQPDEQDWKFESTANADATSLTIKGLRPNNKYQFRILAMRGEKIEENFAPTGILKISNVVDIATAAPRGFKAKADREKISANSAVISWDNLIVKEDLSEIDYKFIIYTREVKVPEAEWAIAGEVSKDKNSFELKNLKPRTNYEVRIDIYGIGSSYYISSSNSVTFTTSSAAPIPPGLPAVNTPPVADAGEDLNCVANEPCTLDASNSFDADTNDSIVSYTWDFGDGETGEGDVVAHTYTAEGTYDATVTVADQDGAISSDSAEITVAASETPAQAQSPTAVIDAYPVLGDAPLEVTFDGSGSFGVDSDIVSYSWDFGDGETDEGETVTHTYEEAGTYTATLTVTDSSDQIGTQTVSIRATSEGALPSADEDEDGVPDDSDFCSDTPTFAEVDEYGCPIEEGELEEVTGLPRLPRIEDSDGDGVLDNFDACPDTPEGEAVDENGCAEAEVATKTECQIADFKYERIMVGVDVTEIANFCGTSGEWKIDIFRTEPITIEKGGEDLDSTPERDACREIVPRWRGKEEVHRIYCGIDESWYYVTYAASFKQK